MRAATAASSSNPAATNETAAHRAAAATASSSRAARIAATIRERNLTQTAAGAIIGVDQGKVSMLLRGRLRGFSAERLLGCLLKLGRDVDVTISRQRRDREGKVRFKKAA